MQTTSRLVLHLAEAARRRDPWAITTALRALVQHEERKKDGGIAEHLRNLSPHAGDDTRSPQALKYLDEIMLRLQLDELILDAHVLEACAEFVLEQQKADVLAAAGLRPRNRVLLTGPPGNGKTSLAEGIATALERPFYVVGYDTLSGSYLGETGGRLREVIDYIGSHECVTLFDEFEGIAKERDDGHEVGEIKRVVAALLVHLERMPPSTVVVAATNHPGMLDRATWRRFQIRLELEVPTRNALAAYFKERCRRSPRLRINAIPTAAALTSRTSGCTAGSTRASRTNTAESRPPRSSSVRPDDQQANQRSRSGAQHEASAVPIRSSVGTLTKVSGRLSNVQTINGNDIWIIVRPVDCLAVFVMATATIPKPGQHIDEVLKKVGPNGRIKLVSMATASVDGIPELHMSKVHSVNGTPTRTPYRPHPTPAPAKRRWWQWWRKNEIQQDADAST